MLVLEDRMTANKYGGRCVSCKREVPTNCGFVEKVGTRFVCWCPHCLEQAGRRQDTMRQTVNDNEQAGERPADSSRYGKEWEP